MYKEGVAVRRIVLITFALLCITGAAGANGRFPQAQSIESVPGGDGTLLYMRTTFGVLVSHDAGKSWRWICERALGYQGQWDPPITVTRDGRLWVGLESGIVSVADGCNAEPSPEIAGQTIKDLTTDPRGETIWAIAGAPDKKSTLFRRAPGGTFEKLDAKGLEELNLLTIEIAPSRPQRIYVSGEPYDTIRGRLYRSDDGGKTFTGEANDLPAQGPFFIAAVDPKDPNRVLVRHLHTTGSDVLLTTDAGKTWKNVLSMKSAMFGFTKSPDQKTYWAASGLAEHGIFRSTDRGEHFEHVGAHGVLCLHAVAGGRLFACENTFSVKAPILALSTDEGRSVAPIAGFGDVAGPVECGGNDAGAAAICGPSWPEIRALILPPEKPDASADASAASDAASGDDAQSTRPSRSCACSLPGTIGPDRTWLTSGLLPLVAWARARKRRGSDRAHPGPS